MNPQTKAWSCDRDAIKLADIGASLRVPQGLSWSTDIENHVETLNSLFRTELSKHCPKPPIRPKKAFLTDELWALRKQKLQIRRRLRATQKTTTLELLARTFHCWKLLQRHQATHAPMLIAGSLNRATTLQCSSVLRAAELWGVCRSLKKQLSTTKKAVLASKIDELTHLSSASDILRVMKPFTGSSNALKKGPKPLPLVRDEEGRPCCSGQEALDRWISFFMCMEGGSRVDSKTQRELWINNLHDSTVADMEVLVHDIPSLVDLEAAFRRVKKGKACGPDLLPSELFHHFPAEIAKQGYAALLKVALQGQECLSHKGGTLVPLWKGKGDKSICSSFRSILLSSHFGKTLHRALRLQQATVYETYLHAQQLGGRRRTPVTLGTHQARAFMRHHKARGRPTALLFLDLTEAFYRVVRPLALSGKLDDDVLAAMSARLKLDPDTLAELHGLLQQPGAIEDAALPPHLQRALRAIHQDTHFTMRGQLDCCRTTLGSRPGDAFADVVFGFLWAKILHKLHHQLAQHDLCEWIPDEKGPKWFGQEPATPELSVPFLGPCWCDDLCICMSAASLQALSHKVAVTSSVLLDLCKVHGMTPNLSKGKTELMFSMRGRGKQAFRRCWFGPQAPRLFAVLGETSSYQIPLVGAYRHLGGTLHHVGDLKDEIRKRLAIAHQSFSEHRKLLFSNRSISLCKRVELFRCLVLSKLLFATDSWVIFDQKTRSLLHASIMRLYKRLLGLRHDDKMTDDAILSATGLSSPSELLRVSRLRYVRTLFAAGDVVSWGLFNLDSDWNKLIEDDFLWMHQQLRNSSPLLDPRQHLAQWIDIIRYQPGYWKRLTSRAMKHAIGQRDKAFKVLQAHQDIFALLDTHGLHVPLYTLPSHAAIEAFGCMKCGLVCRSKAGEGAHMFRVHGQSHPVRKLFQTTQCAICLTEYFTFGKLKMHLIRRDDCRQQWHGLRTFGTPMPGLGSVVDEELLHSDKGLLPPLQAAGPQRDQGRRSDFPLFDDSLYEELALTILHAADLIELGTALRACICTFEISWTRCHATLLELQRNLEEDAQDLGALPWRDVVEVVQRLQRSEAWPFLAADPPERIMHFADVERIEAACGDIRWDPSVFAAPRSWGRHRIVLHAFAGRRRQGDFQFYLDRLLAQCDDGIYIHAVSMDIIYDCTLGDASSRSTQQFWFWGIDQGWVVGFIGGPPCETWSKARGVEVLGDCSHKGPRVIRNVDELWGFSTLGLKELAQVSMGNELLLFSLVCIYRLALCGGVAILEHPAEPEEANAASIWRLQVVILLTHLPGVEVLQVMQGHFGAPSPKPTHLLSLNLPDLPTFLRDSVICEQPPKRSAIGKQADGQWATAKLKEYPPALCFAFAKCFYTHLRSVASDNCAAQADEFLLKCKTLIVQEFSVHFGKDFAG